MTKAEALFDVAFSQERAHEYPIVAALEQRLGYAIDRATLEDAARILACPVKRNPPNWQHGRVIYTVARAHLASVTGPVQLLDIGTAKGFSALCLQWALTQSGVVGAVTSVDVIDPLSRSLRNSVAEIAHAKSLYELLEPWAEAQEITFLQSTGIEWLMATSGRVNLAVVDGKHTFDVVQREAQLLKARQLAGDVVIFDDIHIPGVAAAVAKLDAYDVEYVPVLPQRAYAIARRR